MDAEGALQHELGAAGPVALVIGNNAYKHIGKLRNAIADAEAIQTRLSICGFRVIGDSFDLTHRNMVNALCDFAKDVGKSGKVGLFWFSGHAIEADSKIYLLPIDIDPYGSEDLAALAQLSISLEWMLTQLAAQNAKIVIVLDSCRNNPFANAPVADRSGPVTGLSSEPAQVPENFRIIYAASMNEKVSDDNPVSTNEGTVGRSGSPHGLFTGEMLHYLDLHEPGTKISEAAERATEAVKAKTREQNPEQTVKGTADIELRPAEPGPHLSAIDVANAVRRAYRKERSSTLLATPINHGQEPRWRWPENLLMTIGVDRTQFIGVVAVRRPDLLFDAMCDAEGWVAQLPPERRFGRRRWRLVKEAGPSDEDLDRSFGLIWPIERDVTVRQIDHAIRACTTLSNKFEASVCAGNVVILALPDDQEDCVRQCVQLIQERASILKADLDVCGWCEDNSNLADAVLPIELELIKLANDSQKTSSHESAVKELRVLSGKLMRDLRSLCDWLCGKITQDQFLATAERRAFEIAAFAGLLTGADSWPSPTEATRSAAVVAAANNNQAALTILAGLPVCEPVLRELSDASAAVRATVGLVTNDEVSSVSPPWVGQMVVRGKRRLILRAEPRLVFP